MKARQPTRKKQEASKPRELTMMEFLATEGGRKCPACGKYAKKSELGFTGFSAPGIHVSSYGHLPGFGCNTPRLVTKAPAKD